MQTLLNLLASVALLVWGTHIVRTGVLRVFGADLRRMLSKSVANRFSALLAGLGVTGLVQSSSATALLTSSFVSQNLIALPAALAIMLGADVGSALMAQIFSLDLSWLSPLLILFGVIFFLSRRATRAGQLGRVAIGLGLMLLALQLVMLATKPITEAHGVRVIFATLSGDPMLDMLIGAAFSLLSWSSLAVVLITATLAATNVVSVPVALCLVLGANLGSGLLALIVNARMPGGGRRVAFGNLVFKVAGCVAFSLALPWLPELIARFDADQGASSRDSSTPRRSRRRPSRSPTRRARRCASETRSSRCSTGCWRSSAKTTRAAWTRSSASTTTSTASTPR